MHESFNNLVITYERINSLSLFYPFYDTPLPIVPSLWRLYNIQNSRSSIQKIQLDPGYTKSIKLLINFKTSSYLIEIYT